ncbi:MAG: homoserine kinase [Chitinophagaceae bacterium]|nr:homoserine kinase [Chitinophagaceae bacterium]
MKKVTVHAFAGVGNLVCGFDVIGMALHAPYDVIDMELTEEPGIRIKHTDAFGLPENPGENIIGICLQAMTKAVNKPIGFKVTVQKNIKPGSGLGSSSASCAGAVVAANALLDNRFSKNELVEFALAGEIVASGGKHADNIAPAIFGGITIARPTDPVDIISLPVPSDLFVAIVHPQIEVKTADARKILPTEISMKTGVNQWANVAGLVAGIYTDDKNLIGRSLQDHVAEPYRSKLIPGYDAVIKKSMEAGALGGGISGSGPTMFMLCETEAIAAAVETCMQEVYQELKIDFKTYVTSINPEGVKIVSSE